jgi:hypothetical protein
MVARALVPGALGRVAAQVGLAQADVRQHAQHEPGVLVGADV